MDLSSLGEHSAGVWTRKEALALGGAAAVELGLRTGTWQVPWRGVYADAGFRLSPEQRAWAAVLASGGPSRAVAVGRTAARVWGLPLVDDDDPATAARDHRLDDVAVPQHLVAVRHAGRSLRRRQAVFAEGDVASYDGLPLTSVLRTLTDLASELDFPAAVCAADAALHQGMVTSDELDRVAAERRGRPGGVRVARVVAAADGRAESPLESLTRLLLDGLELEPQVELLDAGGELVARFDLGHRRRRLAVECDGKAAHAGELMLARDRERDRRVAPYLWVSERVTWYDVRVRGRSTRERVRARLAATEPKAA